MPKMISCTREIHVNPEFVSSVHWEPSSHGMGFGDAPHRDRKLVIRMSDGFEHRITHHPGHVLDGNDCYKIERELLAAMAETE